MLIYFAVSDYGSCRLIFFFFQAEDGIRDLYVTGVQTCALPILPRQVRLMTASVTSRNGIASTRSGTMTAPATTARSPPVGLYGLRATPEIVAMVSSMPSSI